MEKRFIFIDNDSTQSANHDIEYNIIPCLESEEIKVDKEEIEVHSGFHFLSREEKMELVFNSDKPLLIYSMLTVAKYNSSGQVELLLKQSSMGGVKGRVAVFFGNNLLSKFLRQTINGDVKYMTNFISAVQRNTLIGQEGLDFFEYKFDFNNDLRDCVVKEKVSLKDILGNGN